METNIYRPKNTSLPLWIYSLLFIVSVAITQNNVAKKPTHFLKLSDAAMTLYDFISSEKRSSRILLEKTDQMDREGN